MLIYPFWVDFPRLFHVNFDFLWNKWKSFWDRLVDILGYLCGVCMKEKTSRFQEASILVTDAIKLASIGNHCSINHCGWFLTLILFRLITSIALKIIVDVCRHWFHSIKLVTFLRNCLGESQEFQSTDF